MGEGEPGPAGRQTVSPRSAWFGWAAMLVGLGCAWALLQGGQELAARLPVDSLAMAIVLFYFALFAPLAILSLVLGRLEHRPVMRLGAAPWRWGPLGLALGVGGLATTVAYVWLHGGLRAAAPEPVPAGFLYLGLAITVLQVGAEEMLFRGWLLCALQDRLGAAWAVVLSALAFSAFHLLGGAEAPLSLVNLMLGGIWFALLAQRSGGILAPFAAHYGWNVAEDLGLGLVPNPGAGEFGALADHDIVAAALWGGSDEGLNASIAMSIVLVALILPLLPALRPARRAVTVEVRP